MIQEEDEISKLISKGANLYESPKTSIKLDAINSDCWLELDSIIKENELDRMESNYSKLTGIQKRSLSSSSKEIRKKKLSHRVYLSTDSVEVSTCYEESIKQCQPKLSKRENFVELYSSEDKENEDKRTLLFPPPRKVIPNVSLYSAALKLKGFAKISLFQIKTEKAKPHISSSISAIFAATAFKRRVVTKEYYSFMDAFDLEYIDLWCRPVHDPLVDSFQITFRNKLREETLLNTENQAKTETKLPRPLSKKNLLTRLISIDYGELLTEIKMSEGREKPAENWIRVNDLVEEWTKRNLSEINKPKE